MIQPNELRIGNWVKVEDACYKVVGVGLILAILNNGIKYDSYMFRKIYPIPLTEDLLVQLGFPNEYATMYETSDGWFLHIDDASHQTAIAIPVKYLHELQNAYFVATKKELDIKL